MMSAFHCFIGHERISDALRFAVFVDGGNPSFDFPNKLCRIQLQVLLDHSNYDIFDNHACKF